jgi:hypothetical protein
VDYRPDFFEGKTSMTIRIALMGAGGKMGVRAIDQLKDNPHYELYCIEVSAPGIRNVEARGLKPVPQDEALSAADVVVLALPDKLIGPITHQIVPRLPAGAMIMSLDPAAAYAGVIPIRADLTYFVVHPCHPPLFGDETSPEARRDWFGGVAAQHLVCALAHGPEADYARGEQIAIDIFGPVIQSHRITVEQMAILEPALVETTTLALIGVMKEAYDEVVRLGVPQEAAWAFLMGHLRTEIAIVFDIAGFPVSDGARLAMQQGIEQLMRPDWKQRVFSLDQIRRSVAEITGSVQG